MTLLFTSTEITNCWVLFFWFYTLFLFYYCKTKTTIVLCTLLYCEIYTNASISDNCFISIYTYQLRILCWLLVFEGWWYTTWFIQWKKTLAMQYCLCSDLKLLLMQYRSITLILSLIISWLSIFNSITLSENDLNSLWLPPGTM